MKLTSAVAAAATAAALLLSACSSGGGAESPEETPEAATSDSTASPSESASETPSETPSETATGPAAKGPSMSSRSVTVRLPDKNWRVGSENAQTLTAAAIVPVDASFGIVELALPSQALDTMARSDIETNSPSYKMRRVADTEVAGVPAFRVEGVSKSGDGSYIVHLGCERNGITYTIGFTFYRPVPKKVRERIVDTILGSWTWK